ncbi:class I SAM-dependent methyltransferase [Glycomyces tritici]|uniref:Class I SAM-dependent methyltransferase n=1 Tax=Glycomyces tritici TaxID=2665176 RepID=A0ABT7YS64_9ACTN|nr:class I SAM-dependent methyltransferase [Glycomyces tritici]MDN3241448.1 class I SAM-dependent methyltransferase [Glycomyces tritici]MDN3242235.1 class I SAM-dependent methyltransferase [Glycomyces tritici]
MAVAPTHDFDKDYWERHWAQRHGAGESAPHPHLARETAGLEPGTALDAGCGTGTEALWLAAHGWQVTGADIAAHALRLAAERAATLPNPGGVRWVEADLTTWEPGRGFDLVTTAYAHSAMPHPDFYRRLATWVAPGGTLLIVAHLHTAHAHGDHPPTEAAVTLADITASVAPLRIETAEEHTRTVNGPGGRGHVLRDAVVRATRPL